MYFRDFACWRMEKRDFQFQCTARGDSKIEFLSTFVPCGSACMRACHSSTYKGVVNLLNLYSESDCIWAVNLTVHQSACSDCHGRLCKYSNSTSKRNEARGFQGYLRFVAYVQRCTRCRAVYATWSAQKLFSPDFSIIPLSCHALPLVSDSRLLPPPRLFLSRPNSPQNRKAAAAATHVSPSLSPCTN